MNSLWETPSCSEFLENIKKEIWSGNIILVFLPKHSPVNFLSELKMRLGKDGSISYEKINLQEVDQTEERPLESLFYAQFELGNNVNTVIPKRVSEIFKHIPCNPTQVFVLENLSISLLPKFIDFLTILGKYFTSIHDHLRHKFIVVIDPEVINPNLFKAEPGTSKHILKGLICPLNQALALRFYFDFNVKKQNPLSENLVISLAQFDYNLAEDLCGCDDFLEEYSSRLIKYASDRGWEAIRHKKEDDLNEDEVHQFWAKGIIDIRNEKLIYHSAFLKIHNKELELKKRIWHSGIQILLPLIEEFRSKLLSSKKIILPSKWINEKKDITIEDKNEFEISDIVYIMNKGQMKFPLLKISDKFKIMSFATLSWNIRNDLSHLKFPPIQEIKNFFREWDNVMRILEC